MAAQIQPRSVPPLAASTNHASSAEIDAALKTLDANKRRWVETSIMERIALLDRIKDGLIVVAADWATTAARMKGLDPDSALAGEEWISGPYALMAYCNAMMHTLKDLAEGRHLRSLPLRELPGGQLAAKAMPQSFWDRLLLNGVSAEVWMEPGVTRQNLAQHTAGTYGAGSGGEGKVALVLGAGNIAAIAPLDCLHKLLVENEVVVLKLNPVNEYLSDFLTPTLAPLIEAGYLRILRGDATVGQLLCNHPLVETIHITGSAVSHDAIVWGVGDEGRINKQRRTPLNPRPITSELGGVGPTIVVPGPWSAADLRFQAEHVATQKLHNAGFNCIASQVLVLSAPWSQKQAFVRQLEQTLASSTPRPLYYPGAAQRVERFEVDAGTPPKRVGNTSECVVTPFKAGSRRGLETVEVFAPALGVTELEPADAEAFLLAAVDYANTQLAGTLGANIIIHPATIKQIGRRRFEEILTGLRYGTIAVNAWSGVGFLLAQAAWGAFPGHTLEDVQSGIGFVHNSLLFDRAERTIVEGPFRPFPRNLLGGPLSLLPRPPWFVTNKRAHVLGRLLTRFQYRPSLAKVPRIFFEALRG